MSGSKLVGIVRQPVFLTTDMVSNHVHIWYDGDDSKYEVVSSE